MSRCQYLLFKSICHHADSDVARSNRTSWIYLTSFSSSFLCSTSCWILQAIAFILRFCVMLCRSDIVTERSLEPLLQQRTFFAVDDVYQKLNFHDRHIILNQVTKYMMIHTSFPFALHCHPRSPSPPLPHYPYPSYCKLLTFLLIFLLIHLIYLFIDHVSMSHPLLAFLFISSSSTFIPS